MNRQKMYPGHFMRLWLLVSIAIALSVGFAAAKPAGTTTAETTDAGKPDTNAPVQVCAPVDGYHGIWYYNQKTNTEYKYKYSGGMGTYPANHIPIAIYAPKVDKTFFVYGGMPADALAPGGKRTLLIMVSYYDHKTGMVPRPRLIMDKQTEDAHDNPVMAIDDEGYIWVFVAAHGTGRPAYLYKSAKPYEIDAFRMIWKTNFSYPQPWYVPGQGFVFLHTRYQQGRRLFCMTSRDGIEWSEPTLLAAIEQGHYQVSWRQGNKIATAFNYHPANGGLNARTNLYYMETLDFGKTWQTVRGQKLELPLTTVDNKALVRDYASMGLLVYTEDLNFDARGNPVILFVTARGWEPGPENGPRKHVTERWTPTGWETTGLLLADNNYDTGCLHIEDRYHWRLIAPTLLGRGEPQSPQAYNPGGEMMMWTSEDMGRVWRPKRLTANSPYNHTYARRPVDAQPPCYAIWADGHGRQPSESRLYFCNKEGDVYMLPTHMEADFAKPTLVVPLAASRPATDTAPDADP